MATEKYYGTGRRKSSIARVYVMPGKGNITINKRSIDEYFGLETLKVIVRQPLAAIDAVDKFDICVPAKLRCQCLRLPLQHRCHSALRRIPGILKDAG